MKYKNILNRRTFLHGVGGAAVGFPFLDEMRIKSVYAQAAPPPERAINIFFGLGMQRDIQKYGYTPPAGWANPLEPLMPFEKKLAFLRGVNQIRADGNGNAHYDGSSGAFTGTKMKNKSTTGGASVDEALRRFAYPNGMPNGMFQSLSAGTWWRRSDSTTRYIHSRKPDGSIMNRPFETPKSLFNKIFGAQLPISNDPEPSREHALRTSVLDSLVDQYRFYQSDAGGLGRKSRAKLADHLDHIRALEAKVAASTPGVSAKRCEFSEEPENSRLPHGDPIDGDGTRLSGDGDGIDITVDELVGEYRLIAELYALAYACDSTRFGSLVFQSAGERIRLKGDYRYNNFSHQFDDRRIRGSGGSRGCSHEFWHAYSDGQENRQVRAHLHLMFREIGYFLGLLDAIIDENGGSILDNAMITISTESGDGRHRSAAFELEGVFHAISSAGGRLRVGNGGFIDVNDHATMVYNTMLRTYGVGSNGLLGDRAGDLDKLKA
ncbi:MAG: DUF1552 domain-containing protein [Myxococcales bacterium]|nr:DUF1552 domain-containing protein [Myxococcales bacterium]